jgi:hypothetical protein
MTLRKRTNNNNNQVNIKETSRIHSEKGSIFRGNRNTNPPQKYNKK